MFLDANGLNPNCLAAQRWRYWFDTFPKLSEEVERKNLDSLIKYIGYCGKITEQDLKVLKGYDKSLVFNKVQEKLAYVDDCQKEILIKEIDCIL